MCQDDCSIILLFTTPPLPSQMITAIQSFWGELFVPKTRTRIGEPRRFVYIMSWLNSYIVLRNFLRNYDRTLKNKELQKPGNFLNDDISIEGFTICIFAQKYMHLYLHFFEQKKKKINCNSISYTSHVRLMIQILNSDNTFRTALQNRVLQPR